MGRQWTTGEDVVAESLGFDRNSVHPEPAADAGIFHKHRPDLASVVLSSWRLDTAADHDQPAQHVARKRPPPVTQAADAPERGSDHARKGQPGVQDDHGPAE